MNGRIRLVLALHNHQPIGNFGGVFEGAYRDSYAPFLEVLNDYPGIPISLHTSGSLQEWLVQAHPEYIDQVRNLVERGQVEILGGPFYEPILASIPKRDRIGQMQAYTQYLELLFGSRIRGMWMPERVWEQSFTADIAQAGLEYTLLDDFHFKNSGLREEELFGYYLTEDEGELLKVFPGSERLRYTIPFRDPWETIQYLREIAERHPNSVVVFGDDGEKFGTWPGTHSHVYGQGWLRRFFDALLENQEWLKVTTLAETVDNLAPKGRTYLPDASYREMTEWALTTDRQREYFDLVRSHEHDHDWSRMKQFMRGGNWRNFRVKYPESNEMYARMLGISRRLGDLFNGDSGADRDLLQRARTEMYRAQCNCPYWHGAFGGLYLPHLRNAVYSHLIAADNLIEQATGREGTWAQIEAGDFNLDARQEVRMSSDRVVAFLSPSRGGHLYEFDIRTTRHNLLATLNRRPEPYHDLIREHAQQAHEGGGSEIGNIHNHVSFKQEGLDQKLQYDHWPRKGLVDHFFQPGLTLDRVRNSDGDIGDFTTGVYETVLRRANRSVEAKMWREGSVGPFRPQVTKTVILNAERGSKLEILYELSNLPQDVPLHFGVEFNFAGMAAGANDRYYYDSEGRQIGQLQTIHDLHDSDRVGLVDEWLGVDVALELSQPAGIWAFPIETISQSEGGYEAVHQSSTLIPHWEFFASSEGTWSVKILLSVDTSAAQARKLREMPATV
ncbi:MAG: DUF1926 domain-containing protein [Planctomycetaceae bacterium]|nr:DUF1926 domain-containing protein [Planctomycetaceae bacterium]